MTRTRKKPLKLVRKHVRECVFWCCIAKVVGLDSRPAVLRCLPDACGRFDIDDVNLVSQLTHVYRKHAKPLPSEIHRPPRIASSTERRVQDGRQSANLAGTQAHTHCRKRQVSAGAAEAGVACASVASLASAGTQSPLAGTDTLAPSSADPILAHPADPPNLHDHSESPQRRSLPPARRSPGPRSRESVNNQQMAQMLDMMKRLTRQFEELKEQVHCHDYYREESLFSRLSF